MNSQWSLCLPSFLDQFVVSKIVEIVTEYSVKRSENTGAAAVLFVINQFHNKIFIFRKRYLFIIMSESYDSFSINLYGMLKQKQIFPSTLMKPPVKIWKKITFFSVPKIHC